MSERKDVLGLHLNTIYGCVGHFRVASTVPQPNSALNRDDENQRSYSAPQAATKQKDMDALPLSPDSSNSNSDSKSSLSNISEAHLDDNEEVNSVSASPKPVKTETFVDPLELSSGSHFSKSLPSGQLAPRGSIPSTDLAEANNSEIVRPTSSSSRLGSGKHRVLPPITTSPQPVSAFPEV